MSVLRTIVIPRAEVPDFLAGKPLVYPVPLGGRIEIKAGNPLHAEFADTVVHILINRVAKLDGLYRHTYTLAWHICEACGNHGCRDCFTA